MKLRQDGSFTVTVSQQLAYIGLIAYKTTSLQEASDVVWTVTTEDLDELIGQVTCHSTRTPDATAINPYRRTALPSSCDL